MASKAPLKFVIKKVKGTAKLDKEGTAAVDITVHVEIKGSAKIDKNGNIIVFGGGSGC